MRICVYDEFETLHRNLAGETIVKPYKTMGYLNESRKKSAFSIIIDAFKTRTTYDYVNTQNNISSKLKKDGIF